MKTKDRIEQIISYFDEILPKAHCELNYSKPYELLIAVMLSAQTTDKSVNKVTEVLFSKYPSLDSLANATYEEVFDCIKTLGLAKTKAKNVIAISKALIENFNYQVPNDQDKLMSLPGVGRKVADCILLFSTLKRFDVFPIDVWVRRVMNELYIKNEDETYYEIDLNYNHDTTKHNYWHKDVNENPESLIFWFDFLDAEGSDISQYSVPMIGSRTKVVNDNEVKNRKQIN